MIKTLFLIFLFCISVVRGYTQQSSPGTPLKGKFFVYWGWNFDRFSRSDIHFNGKDHDFVLKDIVAVDRPTKFSLDNYFNPSNLSTPQYNFRIGYYLTDHYSISIGMDHMKYVMVQNQIAAITGKINMGSKYDGTYADHAIELKPDFLKFEHTNGLNYANIELRRLDDLIECKKMVIQLSTGIGAGVLIPRTDATLLSNKEYDEFHLAGYGIAPSAGIHITFFNAIFLQSEYKAGYINMPDIRTTMNVSDHASQHFWFGQLNFVFGGNINLNKKI